jgi:hypothetical protein
MKARPARAGEFPKSRDLLPMQPEPMAAVSIAAMSTADKPPEQTMDHGYAFKKCMSKADALQRTYDPGHFCSLLCVSCRLASRLTGDAPADSRPSVFLLLLSRLAARNASRVLRRTCTHNCSYGLRSFRFKRVKIIARPRITFRPAKNRCVAAAIVVEILDPPVPIALAPFVSGNLAQTGLDASVLIAFTVIQARDPGGIERAVRPANDGLTTSTHYWIPPAATFSLARYSRGQGAMCRERPDQRLNIFDGRNGCDIAKASEDMPRSTCFHVAGAAVGNPSRTRGE